jgi:hypothetical protein
MTKQSQWFALVAEQEQSSFTVKAFCTLKHIKLSTFHYWGKKYKQAGATKGFIPIVPGSFNNAAIRLSYPNGVNIHLETADLSLIAHLIRLG